MIDNAVHLINDSDIVFVGVNYYGTCGKRGRGPELIRRALNSFSSFNPDCGCDVFDKLRVSDAGDISGSFSDLLVKAKSLIKQVSGLPVILGGEHLISYPFIKSLMPDNVLFFDAHADFFDEYGGKRYSYATVIKRVSELVSNVVIAGVRDLTVTEQELLSKAGNVSIVSVDALPRFSGSLYVSVDLDVLNPVFCPEVSTPIPLGVDYGVLVKVLNNVLLNNNIVGFDITELTAVNEGLSSINAGGLIMNYLKRRCC